MSPAALPIEDVKDKLLTLDDVRERFSKTEPLESETFDLQGTDTPKWDLESDWNVLEEDGKGVSIEKASGLTPVGVKVRIHGEEYGLTKDAMLEATSLIGITKQYAGKSPAHLLQPHLNYWYKNEGGVQGNTLKALSAGGTIQAFTKVSVTPFSNLQLLDAVEDKARERFGNTPLYVDFKFAHDLRRTACRIIVPEVVHDVRDGDPWSAGLQFKQSVVGEKPLVLSGYLFRYWCTNGAITTHLESGNYNRRKEGQGDEVYDWAREKVDEILGGFEHEFEVLDQLANTPIPAIPVPASQQDDGLTHEERSRARALMDVFETYGVPLEQRQPIIDMLNDSDDFTMYGIMQAVTQIANRTDMRDSIRETLMRVGGDLPAANSARCQTCRRLPI